MTLRFCTLTGVDVRTNRDWLVYMSVAYPFVEWGVLYSADRAGVENRYPDLAFAKDFGEFSRDLGLNTAIHLCGKACTDLLSLAAGTLSGQQLADARELLGVVLTYRRVQLNVLIRDRAPQFAPLLQLLREEQPEIRVIAPYYRSNAAACRELSDLELPGLDFLIDSSGGRGTLPEEWPTPEELPPGFRKASVAFAGGMGPATAAAQLARIAPLVEPGRTFSIDMETRIRDEHDWLSQAHCTAVLEQVHQFELGRVADGLQKFDPSLPADFVPGIAGQLSGLALDFLVACKQGHRPVALQPGTVGLQVLDRQRDVLEPLVLDPRDVARSNNLQVLCTAPGCWKVTQGIREVEVPAQSRNVATMRGLMALELLTEA